MPDRRRGSSHHVHETGVVDIAGGQAFARIPDYRAGAGKLAVIPAVEHRSARQHDGGNVDRGGGHQACRRGLVAAGGENYAIDRIAVQDFNETEISEVAIERGGGALAGFLYRVNGELERNAACVADAVAYAARELEMMAVARREIRAGLRNADDRLARLQFFARDAVVHVALEIERGHAGIGGIVEPAAAAQTGLGDIVVRIRWNKLIRHAYLSIVLY